MLFVSKASAKTPSPTLIQGQVSPPPEEIIEFRKNSQASDPKSQTRLDYQKAKWDPLHFRPKILEATDEQCLKCHQEILKHQPREKTQQGTTVTEKAWYQAGLSTYQGQQLDFHARHLTSEFAKQVMILKCNTCHSGSDPREEAVIPPTSTPAGFTLRKSVDPKTCLMCHGQFPHEVMGLPGPWEQSRGPFQNNCLLCHAAVRTTRHEVNYLKARAIEEMGSKNGDVCFGCHGGRPWYQVSAQYPRHAWPGMPSEVPVWAQNRPTQSEERFRKKK